MKNILFILLLFCSFIVISCKNDRSKANANFKFIYLENGGISLKHTGMGSSTIWIIDNKDTISTWEKNPVYYFKDNGQHKVKLVVSEITNDFYMNAADNNGEQDSKEQTVEIKNVPQFIKIEYVKIIQIPFYTDNGDLWDNDYTGPDVKLNLHYYNEKNIFSTQSSPLYNNLYYADLPIDWKPTTLFSAMNGLGGGRSMVVTENTNAAFEHIVDLQDDYFRKNGYPTIATFEDRYVQYPYKYEIGFTYYK